MAGLRMKIDKVSMDRVGQLLGDMTTRMSILTPAFKAMGKVFRTAMGAIFASAPPSSGSLGKDVRQKMAGGETVTADPGYAFVGYSGVQWRLLNPAYAAWKLRRAGQVPILWLTGEMARSFTQVGNPDYIERIAPDHAEFGSKNIRAYYHQEAGVGKSRVKRQIIKMTAAEEDQFVDIFGAYVIANDPERGVKGR